MRTFWQSHTCGVQTYFQPVPCCTSPSAEDRLSQAMVTEEPTGSSHSVPTITPPASPCLYLTVQQQVLMRTSSLFGSRNDEWSCLLVRKPYKSLNDQHGVTTAETGSAWSVAPRLEFHTAPHNSASPASHSRQDYLCYCLSLYSVGSNKWHLNWYFAEPECVPYQGHNEPASPGATQVPMSMPLN